MKKPKLKPLSLKTGKKRLVPLPAVFVVRR